MAVSEGRSIVRRALADRQTPGLWLEALRAGSTHNGRIAVGQLSSAVQVTTGRRYGPGRYRYRGPLRRPLLVLHTIEGSLSYDVARRHENPPHLWYSPSRRELFQTVDMSGPAFALRHPAGTPETNNRGPCLQVELEGFARDTRSWPDEYYANIAQDVVRPLDRFCRETYGVTLVGGPTTRALVYADELDPTGPLATTTSPLRMSAAQWNDAHGIVGHQHVPFNTHWDPGRFRIDTLLRYLGDLDEPRVLRLLPGGQRLLRGTDVVDWQQILADLGFLAADDVDGLFGPGTDAATRRFQATAGLPVDGVVTATVGIAATTMTSSALAAPALAEVPPPPPAEMPPPPAERVVEAESVVDANEADESAEAIVDLTTRAAPGGRPSVDATRAAVRAAAVGSSGGAALAPSTEVNAGPAMSEPVIDIRPPNIEQPPPRRDDTERASTSSGMTTPDVAPVEKPVDVMPPVTTPAPTQGTESTGSGATDRSLVGRLMDWVRSLFGGR